MEYIFIIVHLYLTPPQTWTLLLQHKQTGRQMSLLPASPQEEMFGKVKGQFSAVGYIQCPVERLLTLKCIDLKMPLNI